MFNELYEINVTGKVEKKNGLSYLSWAYAWAEVKKIDEQASYEIKMFDNKPYIYDELLGYMVFTTMTIKGITHDMWLPVMDDKNKSMKDKEYQYKVKKYDKGGWTGEYEIKNVESATMFDINKTLMRCLVKNIAMFGLGLALYTGEDLPEEEMTEEIAKKIKIDFGKFKDNPTTIGELVEQKSSYLNYLMQKGTDRQKQAITLLTGMKDLNIEESKKEINNMPIVETQKQQIKEMDAEVVKMYLMAVKKSKVSELTYEEANKLLDTKEN